MVWGMHTSSLQSTPYFMICLFFGTYFRLARRQKVIMGMGNYYRCMQIVYLGPEGEYGSYHGNCSFTAFDNRLMNSSIILGVGNSFQLIILRLVSRHSCTCLLCGTTGRGTVWELQRTGFKFDIAYSLCLIYISSL